MSDPLHTVQETSELLRVSRVTVHDLIRRRELASLKIGRARRIPQSAIESFVRQRMEKAA
jgi:excisionase family DNA binding protein